MRRTGAANNRGDSGSARAGDAGWDAIETVTLDQALTISEKLSPPDQLRLISLLSEQLRNEMERNAKPVDLLSLAGLGAELWQQIDVAAYLVEERAGWKS